jgi:ornithine carbamoyltransferase
MGASSTSGALAKGGNAFKRPPLRSWVEASKSLPIKVTQVYPERWHISDPALLNANFTASTDIQAVIDADVIITESWPTEEQENRLAPYQVSASLLDKGQNNAIFLPCPSVARGREVTADAMLHKACQSRPAKAFLLHAQNALMEFLVSRPQLYCLTLVVPECRFVNTLSRDITRLS